MINNSATSEISRDTQRFILDKKKEKSLGIATELDLKNAKASYEIAQSNLIISEGNLEISSRLFA